MARAKAEYLEEKRKAAGGVSETPLFNQEKFDTEVAQKLNESSLSNIKPIMVNNDKIHGVYFICPLTNKRLKRHEFDEHLVGLLFEFIGVVFCISCSLYRQGINLKRA